MNIRATAKYTLTQNFLKSAVINRVFEKYIQLKSNTTIVDIGAGSGNITRWLFDNSSARIIAFEIDPVLQAKLANTFAPPRVTIMSNFLSQKIGEPYHVVANIPFMSTTEIIDKLTKDIFFTTGYIIMQKEAAERIAGSQINDNPSTMKSVLLENSFTIKLLHEFKKSDYEPKPGIDTVLIKLERKPLPNYSQKRGEDFQNFVTYLFQHSHPVLRRAPTVGRYLARKIDFEDIPILQKTPSEVTFEEYVKIFEICELDLFFKLSDAKRDLRALQDDLEKNHRTRNSKNWREEGNIDSRREDSKSDRISNSFKKDRFNESSSSSPNRKASKNFKESNDRDEKRTKGRGHKKNSRRGMSSFEKRKERNKYKSKKYAPRRRKEKRN